MWGLWIWAQKHCKELPIHSNNCLTPRVLKLVLILKTNKAHPLGVTWSCVTYICMYSLPLYQCVVCARLTWCYQLHFILGSLGGCCSLMLSIPLCLEGWILALQGYTLFLHEQRKLSGGHKILYSPNFLSQLLSSTWRNRSCTVINSISSCQIQQPSLTVTTWPFNTPGHAWEVKDMRALGFVTLNPVVKIRTKRNSDRWRSVQVMNFTLSQLVRTTEKGVFVGNSGVLKSG